MRKIQRAIFFLTPGILMQFLEKKCENIAKSRQKMIPAVYILKLEVLTYTHQYWLIFFWVSETCTYLIAGTARVCSVCLSVFLHLSLLTMTIPNQTCVQVLFFVCSKIADETSFSSKLPVADRTREVWGRKLCWWCLSSGFPLRTRGVKFHSPARIGEWTSVAVE